MDQRNFVFLCCGLGAAWLIVLLYVLSLAQRGSRLRQELSRVRQMLADREIPR